jgi:hypothetical protein
MKQTTIEWQVKKTSLLYWIVSLTSSLMILLAGCATEKSAFEKARSVGTIEAYQRFLSSSREEGYKKQATEEMLELKVRAYKEAEVRSSEARSHAFRSAKTIRLKVSTNVAEISHSLEQQMIKQVVSYGLRIVEAHDESSDAILQVDVEGEALKQKYSATGSERPLELYSGASINGTITLTVARFSMSQKFSGKKSPTHGWSWPSGSSPEKQEHARDQLNRKIEELCTPDPADFEEALRNSDFRPRLTDVLLHLRE